MMKWTEAQTQAIEQRNSNILVSAAAGSGKTAVLAERIKRLILGDGTVPPTPVNRLLVVTFTEAAAGEMRQKIIAALEKEMEQGDQNTESAEYLRKQLRGIQTANISTFHAFALTILRRYFYLIELDPSFSVCDEFRRKLLLSDALDLLIEESFESEDPEFLEFLYGYADPRNENNVRDMILRVYDFIQAIPNRFEWLDQSVSSLDGDARAFTASPRHAVLRKSIVQELESCFIGLHNLMLLLDNNGVAGLAEKTRMDIENLQMIAKRFEDQGFDRCREVIQSFTFQRFTTKKEEKPYYEDIRDYATGMRDAVKSRIKKLQTEIFSDSLGTHIKTIRQTAIPANLLRKLIHRFHEIFHEKKRSAGVIDFNDIEHYSLEILKNEQVQAEYREKFEYVFIDEYQDTNSVQERFIQAVSRDNNLFMVGDVKQSIYRFRQAEPDIFIRKYNEIFQDNGDVQNRKIDLNHNFRSKPSLLTDMNHIFSKLMRGELSGIVYDKKAALYPGLDYDSLGYDSRLNYPVELALVDMTADEEEWMEDEVFDLKKTELEAYAAAQLIRETLDGDKGSFFFDIKEGKTRRFQRRDIVILLKEARKSGQIYYEALQRFGIEAFVESGEGFFDRIEIETFLNLLRLIDNFRQDIPLVSSLYSPVFGFSLDELVRIRMKKKEGPFYDAFLSYVDSDETVYELRKKCAHVLTCIAHWQREEMTAMLSEFLWDLMKKTGYYDYMGALVGGAQRLANLRALVDKATEYQASGVRGLSSFIDFIDAIKSERIPIGQVKMLSEGEDVVRIMTIHKSKGLEFPMVLVGQLSKKLDVNASREGRVSLHKDIGIALQWENYERHSYKKTLLQRLVKMCEKREERAEAIRVLYVAMTRAQDRLILLATDKKLREKATQYLDRTTASEPDVLVAPSYLDMILSVLSETNIQTRQILRSDLSAAFKKTAERTGVVEKMLEQLDTSLDGKFDAEIRRRLDFVYPYTGKHTLKPKYSVTEITKSKKADTPGGDRQSQMPTYFMSGSEEELLVNAGLSPITVPDPAALGSALHKAFEKLDYPEAYAHREDVSYFEQFLDKLVQQAFFSKSDRQELDTRVLQAYAQSDLFARATRAAQAGNLYRETPFNYRMEYLGEETIVQGVIDCWFREEAYIVVIDFKSGRFFPGKVGEEERIIERYGKQISLYCKALEEIEKMPVAEAYLYLTKTAHALEIREKIIQGND
ncbi:MAG: helicase-exonuclease AddAB subunit AddA [Clostridiales Family XIII bacterium]|jgi:ATP-dependent helicase/nuclease subunit A|nr:helicase-exonuclease AddAB subunit AddA [Clostridiales Family XIII bacterium]